ncbi:hypothetical protein DRP44_05685 [candidate division TA06 bacterium]|uniref:Short-chain dehydrogenase n=1 Tax=candidate division TA06 bacterium TaxID=2250710 RepID=A0A660S722_UNCT6|nr:MAG: hypothetical protein DRP44_05685 [candidate division TA06 bacterium]
MTILIAGGRGFIGKTLTENLKDYNWVIIARSNCYSYGKNCITEESYFNYGIDTDFDTFILSVGSGNFKPMAEINEKDIDRAYEDNFKKPFLYLKRAMNYFISRGTGNIIVINSISAIYPYRNGAIYGTYKSALGMLVKILRKENENKKIKIGQIYLPPIESPMIKKVPGIIDKGLMTSGEMLEIVNGMIIKCENRDIIIKKKIEFR